MLMRQRGRQNAGGADQPRVVIDRDQRNRQAIFRNGFAQAPDALLERSRRIEVSELVVLPFCDRGNEALMIGEIGDGDAQAGFTYSGRRNRDDNPCMAAVLFSTRLDPADLNGNRSWLLSSRGRRCPDHGGNGGYG